jgi:(2S)-methylsuccinyl-CoA dehydrogenase
MATATDIHLDERLALCKEAAVLYKHALDSVACSLAQNVQKDGKTSSEAFNCIQVQSTQLARALAEHAALQSLIEYAQQNTSGEFERQLSVLYASQAIVDFAKLMLYELESLRTTSISESHCFFVAGDRLNKGLTPLAWASLGKQILERERDHSGSLPLEEIHVQFKEMFAKFSDSVIAPIAEETHRKDKLISNDLLRQLAELGVFGISIPEQYGGCFIDHLAMVIATEELSRGSLGAGGSVLTRPEICAKALLAGGTEEQKNRWLPLIASGQKMVCVAVTEPNTGSDVASVAATASRIENGYLLNGEKTWATFAGRAEILCLLARTGTLDSGHKGLSLFIVEKSYDPATADEYSFKHQQPDGGIVEGRAIPTIGYRGMHSFAVSFDNYFVPNDNRIGEEGKGFYLQMQGFAGGRIQTAARAIGVMEAAFRAAVNFVKSRKLFGQHLADFTLTQYKIAQMAAKIQASRQLAYKVARLMDNHEGSVEASLVKLLACKDAEWVTREAMQLHGGMGYSEEYAVSRYFLDARVLSIFEGAEELLALQVITRPYLQQFTSN